MQTLIIYDNTGYIISQMSGEPAPKEPVGIPFLWITVPTGKRVKSVDTTITPHKIVYEDVPSTEVDTLKQQIADLQYSLMMKGVI